VHVEYDIDHPNRARLAGDHGDGVTAAAAGPLWGAGVVAARRRRARAPATVAGYAMIAR
jgi:hypothetical protein